MILHADADAFFASVEQRDDPRLRGRPTIVGGGVVMAASYEARAFGVRGGMGGRKARELCPDMVVVRPRFEAYTEASRALFAVFEETAPTVEGLSLEEAFLDVTGLERISGSATEIAARLRREARERVGLAVSVGVATTKVVAKMASRAAKPDGLLAIEPGRELEFLHPLSVEDAWGVGRSTAQRLNRWGIRTLGDVAALEEAALVAILGRAQGHRLNALAHNRAGRTVRRGRRRRSIGSQSASVTPSSSREQVDATLAALVDRVTRRMRKGGRSARTVTLRMRFADFTRSTRSRTLAHPSATTATILTAARTLLAESRLVAETRGLTLIGVTLTNLSPPLGAIQLELPIDHGAGGALDRAMDEIRERYGLSALRRAAVLRAPMTTDLYSASESG